MITLILAGWVVLGALLFYRLEARVAILANFFAGWAVLPGASYKPAAAAFPYWFMGVCLPSDYLFTKALAIGLAALAGVLLFHARDLRRFRAAWCDVPMAVWCAVPLLSALVHGEVTRDAVSDAGYLAVVWGVPWILGRIYFADVRGLVLAARAIVWAGLCYIPICVVEVITGPQLYAAVYGYEPYRWVGATRYLGYRPIGMLEDGNQLGIWMCSAALLALALLLNGIPLFPKRANLWMAGGLGACAVLCQSAGSILLLAALLPLTLIRKRPALRAMLVGCLGAILIFASVTMTGIVPLREVASRSATARLVARDLAQAGRQSFAWRLGREETYSKLALSKPLVGDGHWNWWQNGEVRPWGLWMLVLGMYGVVGLAALVSILLVPVVRATGAVKDAESGRLRVVMGAVLLMSAIDSMMNGDLIVPYVLMMGALGAGGWVEGAQAFAGTGNLQTQEP